MMTLTRARRLTGYEIRPLPPEAGGIRYGAFDGETLVWAAEYVHDGIALDRLVKAVCELHFRQVLEASGWRCLRCGRSRPLHCHHRTPRSLGGTHRKENLEPLCWECHRVVHALRRRAAQVTGCSQDVESRPETGPASA